jgi:putative transposase
MTSFKLSAYRVHLQRPCRVIGCLRMTVRYRSRRTDDMALRERLRALARERRRFGYRGSTFSCAEKVLS